ncbi:MAG TPA: polyphosphate kinase 1 [Pyrinomonadaceae bacterium]|jgi:polyphosphate kinase|nr:polyphosphate kinase 1 [Pyrinomonadaceae bacterium]
MDDQKESLSLPGKAEQSHEPGAAVDSGETPSIKQPRIPRANPSEEQHFLAWSVSNRDLSQLEFYERILEEAADESVPVLERLKFLAVFSSNLDEFFMVRVSGLKEMLGIKDFQPMPGELTPTDQLQVIRERTLPMVENQVKCLRDSVLLELAKQGVEIVSYESLSDREKKALNNYFMKKIFRVLTPLAVDPAHPFPFIANLSLNIGLTVEVDSDPDEPVTMGSLPRFVRIKVPPVVPRLIPVGDGRTRFILLEELIDANLHLVFPSMRLSKSFLFRVTRDADVEIRDDLASDLLGRIKESLRERRFGNAVRLEVSTTMPQYMIEYLTKSLELESDDVYVMGGILGVGDLMQLYGLDRPELRDKPLRMTVPGPLSKKKHFFDAIRKQDILLHHPYTAYTTVTEFIQAAAKDPKVLAIKICLYRTGKNSPIPEALIEASEQGKQVTAIVEIKARFDEENNIEWASRLVEAGVHVVYGLVNLKTHSKVALVIREEDQGLQTYVHIATGNYNPTTSKVYTDLGLLTANADIGDDATDLFNYLTGFSRPREYTHLMVAPVNLRERMLALIEREIAHAEAGRPAGIAAKINRLTDLEIIDALYRASKVGVKIDLVVRGSCMLRPGVAGLSETVHVRSIVGQFLEHSRIFYFANGGADDVYIGSADWMTRNLDRRVEVVTPILDANLKRYLKDVVLGAYLKDNVKARILNSEGSYDRVPMEPEEEPFNSQLHFEGSISLSS